MTLPPIPAPSNSYVCDTIPAAKLADPEQQLASTPQDFEFFDDGVAFDGYPKLEHFQETAMPDPMPQQPPPRKLCVRHQRMADEGTNLKLQQVDLSPKLHKLYLF